MKTLITIRDTVKEFLSKYDRFVIPVVKFLVMLLVLLSFNKVMGYSSDMSSGGLMFVISLVSAFLPIQLIVLIAGAVGFMHMYAVGLDVAAVYLVMFLLMYLLYLRFAPKYGWLIIIMPMFYIVKLHYVVPIIVGIFIGPVGIVPAAFGVVFYYFTQQVADYKTLMQMASEESSFQGFSYIIKGLMENKEMLLTVIVFAFVIAATYIIYRQSFKYSWIVAIGSGGILSIVLFLMGGIVLEADTNTGAIFLGTIVGVLIAVVLQFFKGILDYSRLENVQFEDDEYYYYVKAVPKIRMEKQNIQVKKITDTDAELDQYMGDSVGSHTSQLRSSQTQTSKDSRARTGAQIRVQNAGQTRQAGAQNVGRTQGQVGAQNAGRTQGQAGAQNAGRTQGQAGAQNAGRTQGQAGTRNAGRTQGQTGSNGIADRLQNPIPQRTQNSSQTRNNAQSRTQTSGQPDYTNAQRQAQKQVYNSTKNQAQRTNTRPNRPSGNQSE